MFRKIASPLQASPACRVSETARDLLSKSPYSAVRRVVCAFDNGQLILRGRLLSFFHKQVAQEAVANLDGVFQVVNEIEVVQLAV